MAEALTYRTEGDYRLPNLTVPPTTPEALGKFALLRRSFLKNHRNVLYLTLLTTGKLDEHLREVQQTATEQMERMVPQMAAAQGVNEQMKAENQMQWVGLMNNIRHSAEEAILSDLIYA